MSGRITPFRAENSHWPAYMEPLLLSATLTSVADEPADNDREDYK